MVELEGHLVTLTGSVWEWDSRHSTGILTGIAQIKARNMWGNPPWPHTCHDSVVFVEMLKYKTNTNSDKVQYRTHATSFFAIPKYQNYSNRFAKYRNY